MQVKAIRKRRNDYAVFFAVGAVLTAWFAMESKPGAAFIFGAAGIAVLVLMIRQNRLLYDASLIRDNCILAVPSAVVSVPGSTEKKETEETVVSTFGALVGNKVYKWGCDGIDGVRLNGIEIDRERIYLTFGNGAEVLKLELLHGMADVETVMNVRQKLLRETGVEAAVSGW